jgi:transposase InsO family protein
MLRHDYPVRRVCRVVAYARSRPYYQPRARVATTLRAAVVRLAEAWPTSGDRRITALLRREDFQGNRQHVARRMRAMGWQGRRPRRRLRTTYRDHAYPRSPNLVQDRTVVRPDHVWVGDITYGRLRDEFVYLAVFMDISTRSIRGWHLRRHLDQAWTLTALRRALAQHRPAIHYADQGVQYAATADIHPLHAHRIRVSLAAIGEATENGYAERLRRTIQEEDVTLHDYADFHEAYQQLGRFWDEVYQHQRIHSALGYLTPVECEAQWRQQPPATKPVK